VAEAGRKTHPETAAGAAETQNGRTQVYERQAKQNAAAGRQKRRTQAETAERRTQAGGI